MATYWLEVRHREDGAVTWESIEANDEADAHNKWYVKTFEDQKSEHAGHEGVVIIDRILTQDDHKVMKLINPADFDRYMEQKYSE